MSKHETKQPKDTANTPRELPVHDTPHGRFRPLLIEGCYSARVLGNGEQGAQ